MDCATARKLLRVGEHATLDEIKQQYRRRAREVHPDVAPNRDGRDFVLLTTAFSILRDHMEGKLAHEASSIELPAEIAEAAKIQERVENCFASLHRAYEAFRDKLMTSTREHIRAAIDSAGSSTELKAILKGRVAHTIVEAQAQIEDYVNNLIRRAASDDRDFLYTLFSDLYTARRRYWLISLPTNPVLLAWFALAIISALFLRGYLYRVSVSPEIVASTWWMPFALLGLAALYVLLKLWSLNPSYQFLPPRLSLFGIHSEIRAQAKAIQPDSSELGAGGAVAGAVAGFFVGGPIGAAVGAGVGAIWGWFSGKSLKEMKEQAKARILEDFDFGLNQLDQRLSSWIDRARADLHRTITETLAQNLHRTRALIAGDARFSRRLLGQSQLLALPAQPSRSPTRENRLGDGRR